MKKSLFILFLVLGSLLSKGQFTKPAGAVTIPTYSFFRNPNDSAITIYQGSVNLYNTFVQHFDTVKLSGWVNNRKLLKYRLIGDSILKDGTASNYRLLHKIDSIMALVKYRNDTVVITGYATRGYVQRGFVLKNDSSKLYERIANKVTSISGASTDVQYPSAKAVYNQSYKQINQIYAVGNSITAAGIYETKLMELLGENWYVNNRGKGGEATTEIKARFSKDVIIVGDANTVIILAGVNDLRRSGGTGGAVIFSADSVILRLQYMYTLAHNARIKVVAVTILPWQGYTEGSGFGWTASKQDSTEKVNAWILNTATDVDYRVDAYTPMKSSSDNSLNAIYDSGDHLHPNTTGYNLLGTLIYGAVTWTPNTVDYKLFVGYTNIMLNQNLNTSDKPTFTGLTVLDTIHSPYVVSTSVKTNYLDAANGWIHPRLNVATVFPGYNFSSSFALQVGDGSADTRILANPNNSFGFGASNSGGSPVYMGAKTSSATPDIGFYNSAGTLINTIGYNGVITTPTNGTSANWYTAYGWGNWNAGSLTTGRIPYKTSTNLADSPFSTDGTNVTAGNNLTVNGYNYTHGMQYFGENIQLLNKAADNFISFASRNTSRSEVVYDLSNVGVLTTHNHIRIAGAGMAGYQFTKDEDDTYLRLSYWTDATTKYQDLFSINYLGNIGFGYSDPGSYIIKANGSGYFATSLTTPTINLSTGAALNYIWKCTNSTTGAGSWQSQAASETYKGVVDGDDGKINYGATALADGTGMEGDYYRCYDAGTYDYGSGNITLAIGDELHYDGAVWRYQIGVGYTLSTMALSTLGGAKLGSGMETGNEAADVLNIKNEDKGDITVSGTGSNSGRFWTIDSKAVTLAKMNDMATASVIGRSTTGTGAPEVLALSGLNIGGNAATVTTNANLTGVVTSVGNATSFAANPSFTGSINLGYLTVGQDGDGVYFEQAGTSTSNEDFRLQSSKSGDGTNYSQFFIDPTDGFSFSHIGTGNSDLSVDGVISATGGNSNDWNAKQAAGNYVNKETGKHLPDNNFTDADSTLVINLTSNLASKLDTTKATYVLREHWNTAYGWGDWHHTTLSGYGITDTPWTSYLPLSGGALTGLLEVRSASGIKMRPAGNDYDFRMNVNGSGGSTKWYIANGAAPTTPLISVDISGNFTGVASVSGMKLISTIATGTAPLTVASTTAVTNLNADLLDGQHGSYYQAAGNYVAVLDTFTMLSKYPRKVSPTFTGTVVLPSTTSIGTITNTELGYVDGVTSAIQTQFTGKVDKETGKHLPDNNFTDADSTAIANLSSSLAAKVALADSVGGATGHYATGKALQTHAALTTTAHGGIVSNTLANTKILVGNGSNIATPVDISGDATITNTGAVTVSNAAGNMRIAGTLKVVGTTDDGSPDSVVTVNAGIFRRSAVSLLTGSSAKWTTKRKLYGHYIDGSANMDSTIVDTYIASAATWNAKLGAAITSLGGLTGATQTFAIGTSGTAPAFSSATTTHTLNIPSAGTASVTAGTISKTEYDTFNGKQAALVNTTNIKSINGTTLLGSGDLSTTQTTVSGNAGTVTVAANTTNATYYPLFTTSATGSLAPQTTAAKLTFNPSTGVLVSTNFQLSDRRLKNHIKPLDRNDFNKIAQIEFRKFYMNDDSMNKQHFGVIAQEVEKVLPEFVNTDEKGTKSVNAIELLLLKVAQLEQVIKDQDQRIEKLENKNRWEADNADFSSVQNKDLCPQCKRGHLKPTGRIFSTKPNTDAFECDNCNYTTGK